MHLSIARRFTFWSSLRREVEALQAALARRLVLIAESDLNDPRVVTPREAGGFGIDAQWSDDFHHALFTVLCPGRDMAITPTSARWRSWPRRLEQTFVYDGIYSRYRRRIHGKARQGLSQHRFLGYIQNHDQVGNRASGRQDQPHCRPGAREDRRGAGADEPFCAHAVSGRRVGRVDPVPVLCRS